jgi:acyl-coenzyme A thioesterase PaaI-like protein
MASPISKTFGTVSADEQKTMTGLEFVQGLATGKLPLNSMAQTLGYDVAEADSGRVIVTAQPTQAHLNPAGTVHGGLAATLLDSAMGLAIHSTLERSVGQTRSSSRFRCNGRSRRKQARSEPRAWS